MDVGRVVPDDPGNVGQAQRVLVERSPEGMSIERVSQVAGVGKSTIYRRWASKVAMIVDAIDELLSDQPRPDTGSLRTDLIELLADLQTSIPGTPAGRVFPRMLHEIASGPQYRVDGGGPATTPAVPEPAAGGPGQQGPSGGVSPLPACKGLDTDRQPRYIIPIPAI